MVFLALLARLSELLEVLTLLTDLALAFGKGVAWLGRGVLTLVDRGIGRVAAWNIWP